MSKRLNSKKILAALLAVSMVLGAFSALGDEAKPAATTGIVAEEVAEPEAAKGVQVSETDELKLDGEEGAAEEKEPVLSLTAGEAPTAEEDLIFDGAEELVVIQSGENQPEKANAEAESILNPEETEAEPALLQEVPGEEETETADLKDEEKAAGQEESGQKQEASEEAQAEAEGTLEGDGQPLEVSEEILAAAEETPEEPEQPQEEPVDEDAVIVEEEAVHAEAVAEDQKDGDSAEPEEAEAPKHTKTIYRVSRKIIRYVLRAEEETDPSLYEEVIEGQERNPEFVLPEDRAIRVELTWDVEEPVLGDIAHFAATLEGYDDLETRLQWQISPDGETWEDIEEANELTYDVEMIPQNYRHYWRILVTIVIPDPGAAENETDPSAETEKTDDQEADASEEKSESDNQESGNIGEEEEAAAEAAENQPADELPVEGESPEEETAGETEEVPEEEQPEKTEGSDVLKEIVEDTVLEIVVEEYDGDEDIEVIDIVKETVEVIEVAGTEEIPDPNAKEEIPAEVAIEEEPVEIVEVEEDSE